MNDFINIYERVNEEVDPEYALSDKLEDIIQKDFIEALRSEYWFDDTTLYHISEIMRWLQQYYPDLYKEALADPDELEGKDEVANALQALGYMKEWHEMEEEELQDPEDIEYWRTAMGYYGETERVEEEHQKEAVWKHVEFDISGTVDQEPVEGDVLEFMLKRIFEEDPEVDLSVRNFRFSPKKEE